jgi:Ni/Fe-hydrogenase subunit HybB-like protein
MRVMNIMLYPAPNSMVFWDVVVLNGYLFLNLIIGWVTLSSDRKGIAPPKWIKPFIYLSIPWAISIHTVTAFLYAGIPGRHFWLSAILAARFLASAFAGGPSLLIILALIVRKVTKFDPGREQIQTLGKIVAYAMFANVFFLGLEFFTAFYSGIPGHQHPFHYLYAGLDGHSELVPLMWTSSVFAAVSLVMLWVPGIRKNEGTLSLACVMLFISLWIDKGFALRGGPSLLADDARDHDHRRRLGHRVPGPDVPVQDSRRRPRTDRGGRDRTLIFVQLRSIKGPS